MKEKERESGGGGVEEIKKIWRNWWNFNGGSLPQNLVGFVGAKGCMGKMDVIFVRGGGPRSSDGTGWGRSAW